MKATAPSQAMVPFQAKAIVPSQATSQLNLSASEVAALTGQATLMDTSQMVPTALNFSGVAANVPQWQSQQQLPMRQTVEKSDSSNDDQDEEDDSDRSVESDDYLDDIDDFDPERDAAFLQAFNISMAMDPKKAAKRKAAKRKAEAEDKTAEKKTTRKTARKAKRSTLIPRPISSPEESNLMNARVQIVESKLNPRLAQNQQLQLSYKKFDELPIQQKFELQLQDSDLAKDTYFKSLILMEQNGSLVRAKKLIFDLQTTFGYDEVESREVAYDMMLYIYQTRPDSEQEFLNVWAQFRKRKMEKGLTLNV